MSDVIVIPNPDNKKLYLNLGCGTDIKQNMKTKWINVDIRSGPGVAYVMDVAELQFPDRTFGVVYACHLLEHFPMDEAESVVREWVRVLEDGGMLYVAVPDILKISTDFFKGKVGKGAVMKYFYGGQGHEYNFHKSGYCESILRDLMRGAGLTKMERWKGSPDDASNSRYSLNLRGVRK